MGVSRRISGCVCVPMGVTRGSVGVSMPMGVTRGSVGTSMPMGVSVPMGVSRRISGYFLM